MPSRTQTLDWLNARIDELEIQLAAKDALIASMVARIKAAADAWDDAAPEELQTLDDQRSDAKADAFTDAYLWLRDMVEGAKSPPVESTP